MFIQQIVLDEEFIVFTIIDSILTPSDQPSSTGGALAAVFVILTVFVLAAVLGVIMVLIILKRRTNKGTITAVQHTRSESEEVKEIINPTYTSGITHA